MKLNFCAQNVDIVDHTVCGVGYEPDGLGCKPCEVNYYKGEEGPALCQRCPQGQDTAGKTASLHCGKFHLPTINDNSLPSGTGNPLPT